MSLPREPLKVIYPHNDSPPDTPRLSTPHASPLTFPDTAVFSIGEIENILLEDELEPIGEKTQ